MSHVRTLLIGATSHAVGTAHGPSTAFVCFRS
jgi:hypothetical protein